MYHDGTTKSLTCELPNAKIKIGNSLIVVHSRLVTMAAEERRRWFDEEWEKGNPVLRQIAEAVNDCYLS